METHAMTVYDKNGNPVDLDKAGWRVRDIYKQRMRYNDDPEYRELIKKKALEYYYRRKQEEGIHSGNRGRPRKY